MPTLKDAIEQHAAAHGIEVIGFTTAEPFHSEIERLDEMAVYYERTGKGHTHRNNRLYRQKLVPKQHCPEANSIIIAAEPIPPGSTDDVSTPGHPRSLVATVYAGKAGRTHWYEKLDAKMRGVSELLRERGYHAFPFTNYAVVVLRAAAVRAGIAQRGKNGLVYNETFGSWIVLSAIYTDAVIPADKPMASESTCGKCTTCQKACPYGALGRPYVVDVQVCRALYLPLYRSEPEKPVSESRLRNHGNRFYGCDICQAVCPKNRNLPDRQKTLYSELDPDVLHPDLLAKIAEQNVDKRRLIHALVSLGNLKDPVAVSPILEHLRNKDHDALVRFYAAWALGRIGDASVISELEGLLASEESTMLERGIEDALRMLKRDVLTVSESVGVESGESERKTE
jgi:epoxyqueuosine reductase